MEDTLVLPEDAYNKALVAQVHPPDWANPEPATVYNLVVLGAGTAGLVTAAGAAGLGAKVALVERHLMGGDCLNVGCVPSKALVRASKAAAQVRDANDFGIELLEGGRTNFPVVMERLRRLRASLSTTDSAARFRSLGVDVFFGQGEFAGPDSVTVAGQTLRFRKAVIATGTRARRPEVPGLVEAGFLTNETIFDLTELPARLVVIGAGPIGCELAQAFARLGSRVALLSNQGQILPREDPDAARRIEAALVHDGIHLVLDCSVREVRRQGAEKIVQFSARGQASELPADAILLAAGRDPNVQGLGLDRVGVAHDDRRGVQVNDRLQTTNRRIYAAGDICSPFKFTHAADATARIVIRNALFAGRARMSALTIPWCTYTDPEIAHVGLYESQAKRQGVRIQTFLQEFQHVDRAVLDGDTMGCLKVHVRAGSDRIVGATLVARHAGDMISELTLAMVAGLGLRTLAKTIHPYPTQAEAIKKIADTYNRTRLTPRIQWLLGKWLRWTL